MWAGCSWFFCDVVDPVKLDVGLVGFSRDYIFYLLLAFSFLRIFCVFYGIYVFCI